MVQNRLKFVNGQSHEDTAPYHYSAVCNSGLLDLRTLKSSDNLL